MLAIPAFQASTQPALIRANNKPPLEVVVANLNIYVIEKKRLQFTQRVAVLN